MEKAHEKDWEYNERNGACTPEWGMNIICFLEILAHERYSLIVRPTDRRDILRTYRHISKCKTCMDGYVYFKEVLASNQDMKDVFSADNFHLLRENEKTLDEIIKKK